MPYPQLESSEDQRAVLEAIGDGVVTFDVDGLVSGMNPAAERLTGQTAPGSIGGPLAALLPGLNPLRDGLADQPPSPRVIELLDGISARVEIIRFGKGAGHENSGGAVILREPSAESDLRARLLESELRFRSIVESSPMGIHMYDIADDGHLVFAGSNPAADLILGVNNSTFLGKPIEEAFPPLAWTEVPSRYRDAASRGSVWRTEQIEYQDGVIRGAFEVTAFQTSPGRMAAMFTDITERKRTEDERWKLTLVMQNVGELVSMATPDGRLLYLNQAGCRIVGIDPKEVQNYRITDIVPDELCETKIKEALPVLLAGGSWEGESQYVNLKTGKVTDVHAIAIGVTDPRTGELMFLANISLDITEKKKAEQERLSLEAQIQHSQKLESLGVLAGGIAHDFNNILMGVMGNADLAMMELPVGSPARERLESINRSAAQAADLCRQMLAYSGKGRFVVEVLDLAEVARGISAMLEVSVLKKAALRYLFGAGVPPVRADASQLRQIILNLVTNASEAITDHGVITVCTGVMHCDRAYLGGAYINEELPEGLYSYIEVADTGMGMDRETITRIFDPFFTTKFTGRGLGLSAVMGIIRGHKGTIKIYSEPGRGSIFKVLLPAVEDGERPRPLPIVSATDLKGTGTVLLVDDEPLVREVAGAMLRHFGFGVIECEDGVEALHVFRERSDEIVCVLLDLTMPNMDGEEAFRELRRIKADVKVIMTSGYNEQEITQRFVGRGLAGFIQKPYFAGALMAKLKEVLG